MESASINIIDALVSTFSTAQKLCSMHDMDCTHRWECSSIDRIAFALDLWNVFHMRDVGEKGNTKSDFIFALQLFFQPFDPKDMIKDFVHIRDNHTRDPEDIKYLITDTTMPLCYDPQCKTLNVFNPNNCKYYAQMISNGELKENEICDFMTMIHAYFSHKYVTKLAEDDSKTQDMGLINTEEIKPWIGEEHVPAQTQYNKRFISWLKAQHLSTLALLFYNVKRKLRFQDTAMLLDIMLRILPSNIDKFHLDLPSNIFEEPYSNIKDKLVIFKGILLPKDLHNVIDCDDACNHRTCLSVQRIIFIMKIYKQIKHGKKAKKAAVKKKNERLKHTIQQLMLCEGYSSQLFMDDFNQIKSNHLHKNIESWKHMIRRIGECKQNCYIAKRHRRDSDKYDDNIAERQRIYENSGESNEVVPLQFLDKVHCFLMHKYEEKKIAKDAKKDVDITGNEEKKVLKDTKNKPVTAQINDDGTIDISQRARGSRFNTEFMPNKKYEFGELFYHWKYYKEKETYINPQKYRYRNLKHEMLNNNLCRIGIYRWRDTLMKAITHKYSRIGRELKATNRGDINFNRSIPEHLCISIAHMTVILLYTNYEEPQRDFKAQGMRSDVENHCEISHFYKLFHEAVRFFGRNMTENIVLYHGINTDKLYFTEYHPKFNIPISTTTVYDVAKAFCGDSGLLLILKADKSIRDQYFECDWCSDHDEEEYLFANAHHLFITDIRSKHDLSHSNTKYIKAMSLFQDILDNKFFSYSMVDYKEYENVMEQCISALNQSKTSKVPNVSPYISDSFRHLYDHFQSKQIQIIKSEYDKLQDKTRTMIQKCFPFSKDTFVEEFDWQISKSILSERVWIDSEKEESFKNAFTFLMYVKARKKDKVSVGIWVKTIHLKEKEVHIEWGFKCKQTKFSVSKVTQHFKPNKSDAYRAFTGEELTKLLKNQDFTGLTFTFYLKLLPH